jgi:hypothetical protein
MAAKQLRQAAQREEEHAAAEAERAGDAAQQRRVAEVLRQTPPAGQWYGLRKHEW